MNLASAVISGCLCVVQTLRVRQMLHLSAIADNNHREVIKIYVKKKERKRSQWLAEVRSISIGFPHNAFFNFIFFRYKQIENLC